MVVILISVQLKRFLAEGPLWYSQYEDKICKEYWWTNLLYINNFHPKDIGGEVWSFISRSCMVRKPASSCASGRKLLGLMTDVKQH